MFGTFAGGPPPTHETYGPAFGDSVVEHKIGMRGYDGGVHNSPFQDGRIKEPFTAPGTYNPFMFMKPRRRRLNMLAVFQVIALPFAIFGITTYLFGFSVHNNDPKWCWIWMAFCLVLSFVFLVKAFMVFKKYRTERWQVPWYLINDDDTWFLVLGVQILISSILGFVVGQMIFESYTLTYYRLSLLHTYEKIDPIAEGKAYLDAGSVVFKNDTFVDASKGIGYKDGSVYCVAPIKLGNNFTANFDFWAVGKDCCTGFPGNFNCFDNRINGFAHAGLRVVDNADIPFYRLAVSQAMGEFKPGDESNNLLDNRLNSPNPLFFEWMQDPVAKVNQYWNDAVWNYKIALFVFFVLECIVVTYLAFAYWKNRLWG